MADYTDVFERVEQKYLLDSLQFEALWAVLEPYMRPDEYGRSTICNIYFDTPNYLLARLSGEKPVYKEKLRLRTYGVPKAESPSFVELKKKYQGIVYKRRIVIPYGEAYDWLVNGQSAEREQPDCKRDCMVTALLRRFKVRHGAVLRPCGTLQPRRQRPAHHIRYQHTL